MTAIRIITKGAKPTLEVDGRVRDRGAKVITTAGAVADLAAQWAVKVTLATDSTRRRKTVERDKAGLIIAVIDEVAT